MLIREKPSFDVASRPARRVFLERAARLGLFGMLSLLGESAFSKPLALTGKESEKPLETDSEADIETPIVVVDSLGEHVFAKRPQRIVALQWDVL